VVSNAVLVLKHLVQSQPRVSATPSNPNQSPLTIISHLARRIDDIHHAQAKACVLWLVGQHSASLLHESGAGLGGVVDWAPDVLRKSAKSFVLEVLRSLFVFTLPSTHTMHQTAVVKLQIMTLAAKLSVLCPTERSIRLLNHYVFSLARYDVNYDVRDRARMLSSLTGDLSWNLNEDEKVNRGGVILRSEQIRLVLFEGKAGIVEDQGKTGTTRNSHL
jgi:AP-3 complex subunit beta